MSTRAYSPWLFSFALCLGLGCGGSSDPANPGETPDREDAGAVVKQDARANAEPTTGTDASGATVAPADAGAPGADGPSVMVGDASPMLPPAPSGTGGPASVDDLPAGNPAQDKEYQVKVEGNSFELWIPGGIDKLRCIVTGGSKRRELARLHNCAQMSMPDGRSDGVKEPTGPGIVQALKQLAQVSGRPEIEHLHMLASGYSYTAGHRIRQVRQIPERFLALFTGGIGGDRPGTAAEKAIPWISFDGEKDGPRDMGLHKQLQNNDGRTDGGLFAKAIRWGAGHQMGDSNNFMFAFYHQAIVRRIPRDASAEKGPITIAPLKEQDGWLVDVQGWQKQVPAIAPFASFPGDKTKAGWVIDSYTAHVWQAFTAPASPVRLANVVCPACDNCTPMHRKVGDPFAVEVTVTKPATSVDLYDGDKKLATLTAPPYKFPPLTLPAGVHALIARATFPDGTQAVSRPGALVVTKVTPTVGLTCD